MRPIGLLPIELLFAIMSVQCKRRRIEAKMWKARNTSGFFWATQARGVERCVWEQAAWGVWATADGHAVATILYDQLKVFGHVAYRKLIDAAVRTRFPVRQLELLLQLYQAAGAAGTTRHHSGVCFRNNAPPAAAGGSASGSTDVRPCRG